MRAAGHPEKVIRGFRLLVSLVAASVAFALGATQAQADPPGSGWVEVLNEGFDNAGRNVALWSNGWTNPQQQAAPMGKRCPNPKNVSQTGDGVLKLVVTSEAISCANGNLKNTYSGGILNTNPYDGVSGHQGFEYKYGYVEWYASVPGVASSSACPSPGCVANWPGFWSYWQESATPRTQELDVAEGKPGNSPDPEKGKPGLFCYTLHAWDDNGLAWQGCNPQLGGWTTTETYHKFALDWSPSGLTFYYDDVPQELRRYSQWFVDANNELYEVPFVTYRAPMASEIPDQFEFLVVHNFSTLGGSPTRLNTPVKVNWVKVWQRPKPPTVGAISSSEVKETSALLQSSVNPEGLEYHGYGSKRLDGTYKFECSSAPGYGSGTISTATTYVGPVNSMVNVSATVTGLMPGTSYHCRLSASNAGGTSYSADQTFTTIPAYLDPGTWGTRVSSTDPNAPIFLFFRGDKGHLAQVSWDGANWNGYDRGSLVAPGTSPAVARVRSTDPNAPIYVFYRNGDSNGNLTQTWYNGFEWLTKDTGKKMAAGSSPVVARPPSTDPNAPIYVFYRNNLGNLTRTWYNGSEWLTVDMGEGIAANTSPTVARMPSTDPNAPIYVFYRSSNASGNLMKTEYNGVEWKTQNMGGEIAAETSPSVARVNSLNPNAPISVFYQGAKNKLIQTWYNEFTWSTEPTPNAAELAVGASPAAVRSPSPNGNAPIHVFYRQKANNKLTDTWWNEFTWSSAAKGDEVAAGVTPLVLRPPSTNPNASIWTYYKSTGTPSVLKQTWYNEFGWSTQAFTTVME